MAFAFNSSPAPFGGNTENTGSIQTQIGPDLQEITTEAIGFQTIAGDAKLRLLPSSWPSEKLPPATASLLSIASGKGLLAAAGPESVVIAGTEAVRQAFTSGEGNIKSFTPQLTLNLGMRVSQVSFSADEQYLVLSAEAGGGLAVYEVKSLLNGGTQTAFEISTNGMSLRALTRNPVAEKAELLALLTTEGQLLMANLTTRQLLTGAQGPVMKEGVSCISWSTLGKQLVAGLADGSCCQLTPEGQQKGTIPRPPNVEGTQHGE